jgi:hypothetical protein
MYGVTLKDKKSMEELRERLGIESESDVTRRGRMKWFDHMERKEDDDWVKACQRVDVNDKTGRG